MTAFSSVAAIAHANGCTVQRQESGGIVSCLFRHGSDALVFGWLADSEADVMEEISNKVIQLTHGNSK